MHFLSKDLQNSKEAILESILTQIVRRIFRGIKNFDLKTQLSQAWLFNIDGGEKREANVFTNDF